MKLQISWHPKLPEDPSSSEVILFQRYGMAHYPQKIGLFSTTERRYGMIYSTYFYMFAYDAKEKQEVTTEIPLTKTTHNIKQKQSFAIPFL